MSSMATSVTVRFRTEGAEKVRAAIDGATRATSESARSASRESQASSRVQERVATQTERVKTRAARQAERAQETASRQAAKVEKRAQEDVAKAAQRTEREKSRAAQTAARNEARAAEDTRRAHEAAAAKIKRAYDDAHRGTPRTYSNGGPTMRQWAGQRREQIDQMGTMGRLGMGLGFVGMLATAITSAMSSAQQVLGVRSISEVAASSVDVRQNLIRQMVPAGFDAEQRDSVFQRASEIGANRGVSTEQILAGIGNSQEQFSSLASAMEGGPEALEAFFSNLDYYAVVANASGSSFNDVQAAAGVLQRQLHLSAAETREALAILYQGSMDGSLAFEDFATVMPEALAPFLTARGIDGLQAAREFQAIGQGLRAGDVSPEKARTGTAALLTELSDVKTQRKLRRAGVNVTDDEGNIRSMSDIVAQVAASPRLRTSTQVMSALGNQEAASAMSILVNQERAATAGGTDARGNQAMTLRQRERVDANAGRQTIQDTYLAASQDPSGRAVRLRASREAAVYGNSANIINGLVSGSEDLTTLENEAVGRSNPSGDRGRMSSFEVARRLEGTDHAVPVGPVTSRAQTDARARAEAQQATSIGQLFAGGGAEQVVAATNNSTQRLEAALNNNAAAIRELSERVPNVGREPH